MLRYDKNSLKSFELSTHLSWCRWKDPCSSPDIWGSQWIPDKTNITKQRCELIHWVERWKQLANRPSLPFILPMHVRMWTGRKEKQHAHTGVSTYVELQRINVRGGQKLSSFCLAAPLGVKTGSEALSKQTAVTQSHALAKYSTDAQTVLCEICTVRVHGPLFFISVISRAKVCLLDGKSG